MKFWFKKKQDFQQTLARFNKRAIIVHQGLPENWLPELFKQAGGGGIFRVDIRLQNNHKPTPLEQFIHTHILPLNKALPCFVFIQDNHIFVRHLRRGDGLMHPSELTFLFNEITYRFHYQLDSSDNFRVTTGLDLNANTIDFELE
jgi:hypothetical protein